MSNEGPTKMHLTMNRFRVIPGQEDGDHAETVHGQVHLGPDHEPFPRDPRPGGRLRGHVEDARQPSEVRARLRQLPPDVRRDRGWRTALCLAYALGRPRVLRGMDEIRGVPRRSQGGEILWCDV